MVVVFFDKDGRFLYTYIIFISVIVYEQTYNKKLAEQCITELMTTDRLDISYISDITDSSTQDLSDSLINSPEIPFKELTSHKKITNYINKLLPPQSQVYHPELSLLFKDLDFTQKNENISMSYVVAEKIFEDYSHMLSFDNAIKILLTFVENDLFYHRYEQALVVLHWIQDFYPMFSDTQKKDFDFFIAQCYFRIGVNHRNRTYLHQAIDHGQRLLDNPHIDKLEINITLFFIIISFSLLGIYTEALDTIEEYLRIFPLQKNNPLLPKILLIQWNIYTILKQHDLAIQAFYQYLTFDPENTEIKQQIRLLSEKEGE